MTNKSTLGLIRIIVSSVFVCFFGACAAGHNIKISDKDLSAIKVISFDPVVEVPELPWVHALNLKGLAGGVAAAVGNKKDSEMLQQYLIDHNIKISEIVSKSFKKTIEQNKLFKIQDNAANNLKLKINIYGFTRASAFAYGKARPSVAVTATLISEGNSILWKKYDYSGSSGVTVYPFEELLKDPVLVAKSLSEASDVVAGKLLSELESASPNQ